MICFGLHRTSCLVKTFVYSKCLRVTHSEHGSESLVPRNRKLIAKNMQNSVFGTIRSTFHSYYSLTDRSKYQEFHFCRTTNVTNKMSSHLKVDLTEFGFGKNQSTLCSWFIGAHNLCPFKLCTFCCTKPRYMQSAQCIFLLILLLS